MKVYLLLDDIERRNTCQFVSFSLPSVDAKTVNITNEIGVDTIKINNISDYIAYFDKTYGTNLFGYFTHLYPALDEMKNAIIKHNMANYTESAVFMIKNLSESNTDHRYFYSEEYKYSFNKNNGMFMRWGAKFKDNPNYAPMGPEIADIEISTICNGIDKVGPCKFCYKSNTPKGNNMSLQEFKEYLDILNQNKTIMQIAFGIGDIDANPDLEEILTYTRSCGIIPNITINGARMTRRYYDMLASLCGAVAVSHYEDTLCFNAVKELTDRIHKNNNTLNSVNIHQLLSEETYDQCMDIIDKAKTDERLKELYAIVYLTVKPIGNRNTYKAVGSQEKYDALLDKLIKSEIGFGFDSCGCYNFLNSVRKCKYTNLYDNVAESCESTLFSIYVNCDGLVSPCSFTEKIDSEHCMICDAEPMKQVIDLHDCDDLLMDVWYTEKFNYFRRKLLNTAKNSDLDCRTCPAYNLMLKVAPSKQGDLNE